MMFVSKTIQRTHHSENETVRRGHHRQWFGRTYHRPAIGRQTQSGHHLQTIGIRFRQPLGQGGIAAVRDPADSVAEHVQDTLVAGGGLCERDAVQFILENASKSIDWLVDQGVPFSREDEEGPSNTEPNGFHLTREGGHSRRRILHVADATGDAVQNTLEAKARNHPNIQLFEHHMVIDLITGDRLGEKSRHSGRIHSGRTVATRTHPDLPLHCSGLWRRG